MAYLVFLGTGGGGYVTFSQFRRTGGIYCDLNVMRFVIDPGPGSLVAIRKLKLRDPRGVLLSHAHPDHYTDVDAILDGVAEKYKDSFLIAEKHCLEGEYKCVATYIQKKVASLFPIEAGDVIEIKGLRIKATRCIHTAPCVGFVIESEEFKLGYVSDGYYYEGQEKQFEGCKLLIFNVLVPHGEEPKEPKHMSIDGVISFLNGLDKKPALAVLTHFSFWILRNNVNKQAKIVEKRTGVRTIAARDFMRLELEKVLRKRASLESFCG